MTNSLKRGLIEKQSIRPSKRTRDGESRLFEFRVNRMKLEGLISGKYTKGWEVRQCRLWMIFVLRKAFWITNWACAVAGRYTFLAWCPLRCYTGIIRC
jgi:hypothetical protein